jgi:hypothetical protein
MRLKRILALSLPAAACLVAAMETPASAQYGYSVPATTAYPMPENAPAMHAMPATPAHPIVTAPNVAAAPEMPELINMPPAAQGEIDRLLAAAETSEEIRVILARYDRWRRVKVDPLLRQFLLERFTAAELASVTTLSREYRAWLVETLIERGEMIDQAGIIPNFRLLPAVQAASWAAIWNRSFAPYLRIAAPEAGARVVALGHPHAHLRAAPSEGSAVLARIASGAAVTELGGEGAWVRVSSAGLTGYLLSSEVARAGESGMRYTGPESLIYWRNMPTGNWEGYDSAFGWVYPRYTQSPGGAHEGGMVAESR